MAVKQKKALNRCPGLDADVLNGRSSMGPTPASTRGRLWNRASPCQHLPIGHWTHCARHTSNVKPRCPQFLTQQVGGPHVR